MMMMRMLCLDAEISGRLPSDLTQLDSSEMRQLDNTEPINVDSCLQSMSSVAMTSCDDKIAHAVWCAHIPLIELSELALPLTHSDVICRVCEQNILNPNTHRRHRRDATVELSRVGGVYIFGITNAVRRGENMQVVHWLSLFTAQCTLVHLRGLGIACRLSVRLSVRL